MINAVRVWFGFLTSAGWRADYETDAIIQKSLRTELGKDVTLLTVAHRLQTIMDSDKIVSHCRFVASGRADVFRFRADGPRGRTYRESTQWQPFVSCSD